MNQLNFPILDAHIHQWNPYTTPHSAARLVKAFGKYPKLMDTIVRVVKPKDLMETLGITQYALSPYLPFDYRVDSAGCSIDSVIHVEANWHHQKNFGVVEETKWIHHLPFNQQQLKLAGIVATADPRNKRFLDILKAHQDASPHFCGIRKMAAWHPDDGIHRWCDQPHLYTQKKFLKGFEHLAKMNLSFDAWGYSTQIKEIKSLAQNFPDTKIMVDHLATPVGLFGKVGKRTGRTPAERELIFAKWKEDISELAEQKNVYTKISGLMMPLLGHQFYKQQITANVLQIQNLLSPLIEHATQSFGTERIVFASNFPMDKPNTTLKDLIQAYIEMTAPLGEKAQRAIFRSNAETFYQINKH